MKIKALMESMITLRPANRSGNATGKLGSAARRYRQPGLCIALAVAAMLPAGCGAYYYGRWHRGGVVVAVPPPQPQPVYTYQYYYDPAVQAYYCYYPGSGWTYYPGMPPPNAVYWAGPPPVYLPPPPPGVVVAPPLSFDFYFDPVQHVYYYRDPHFGWRYYRGRPPVHARFWRGPRPRMLPHPPRGAPFHRGPRRGPWDNGPGQR